MDDLKIIRKHYGEKMMHLCRELFPSLLETPGVLSNLMLEHFEPSKFLYDDIINERMVEELKYFIYTFIDVEKENKIIETKSPKELLSEAGYDLYECKTEEDIQYFKKYYKPGEELCTFRGGRLDTCDVFFAVKKNVSEIKRENFENPKREDEYGISVISIQFRKDNINTISIKNRYNHTVNNPDNTFNNNLDNIIPGLNESFRREYNYKFNTSNNDFELPGYVNVNGKFYKYNYEINNIYYCPNNIIIDNFNVIDKYAKEPERYIVLDYFIIDLKEKTIELYDKNLDDSFQNTFLNIEKIVIEKNKETGNKKITIIYDENKHAIIVINNKNQMIEYHNDYLIEMKDDYLLNQLYLTTFEAQNLKYMGMWCLYNAKNLTTFLAQKLESMGRYCLKYVPSLTTFEAPNLEYMDNDCLYEVPSLATFTSLNLEYMGDYCLYEAPILTTFTAPKLESMGRYCLYEAPILTTFSASALDYIPEDCLSSSPNLITFYAPNLVDDNKRGYKR